MKYLKNFFALILILFALFHAWNAITITPTEWKTPFFLSIAFFVIFAVFALIYKRKRSSFLSKSRILFIGTFLSAIFSLYPIYSAQLSTFQAIATSIQHAFRFFALDGSFFERIVDFKGFPDGVKGAYLSLISALYVFAPVLSFTVILSFFENVLARWRYFFSITKKIHVFSELNPKTLALAKSIMTKKPKKLRERLYGNLVVFTDVIENKEEEAMLDLLDEAKSIGAILFHKDLASIKFRRKLSLRKVNFYLISEDENEKLLHTEHILKNYDSDFVELRVFSDNFRTEMFLNSNTPTKMKLLRINDTQSLIYHNLYKNGPKLFELARKGKDEKKIISAVVVGLGRYGREMLKALSWYCQLDGYTIKINAFDKDPDIEKKLSAMLPELLDNDHNKQTNSEDARYDITIHPGIDVNLPEFGEAIRKLTDATYIFVALSSDEANLKAAAKIREICEGVTYDGDGHTPAIETVIYNSKLCNSMKISWEDALSYAEYEADKENATKPIKGAKNFKSEPYNILMTGDLDSFYSEETIMSSKLEKAGLAVHLAYCMSSLKLSFTEDYLWKSWLEYVSTSELKDTWEEHFKAVANNSTCALSVAKRDFSFRTSEEDETFKTTTDAEVRKQISNRVAERCQAWEVFVYDEFSRRLKQDKSFAKAWEKTRKTSRSEAFKSFYLDYNHHSSIAKAIHKELRTSLFPNEALFEKEIEELTLAEKIKIGRIEHIRWNAYMRTEGYSFSVKRNDLAKKHHNLVPASELSHNDLRKDV